MRSCMFALMMSLLAACQEEIADSPDEPEVGQFKDLDGDGYGRRYKANGMALPATSSADDCNDGDATVYPDASAPDIACDAPLWTEDHS